VLPAAARLRRSSEFDAVRNDGCRAGRRLLSGRLLVRAGADDPARVGFVVGRAVGPAVTRNKVKRRLRHAMRGYLGSLPDGSLLVVRAHPQAATARQADLAAELGLVISKLLRRQGEALRR
jgi:ribonuclease P protein component